MKPLALFRVDQHGSLNRNGDISIETILDLERLPEDHAVVLVWGCYGVPILVSPHVATLIRLSRSGSRVTFTPKEIQRIDSRVLKLRTSSILAMKLTFDFIELDVDTSGNIIEVCHSSVVRPDLNHIRRWEQQVRDFEVNDAVAVEYRNYMDTFDMWSIDVLCADFGIFKPTGTCVICGEPTYDIRGSHTCTNYHSVV